MAKSAGNKARPRNDKPAPAGTRDAPAVAVPAAPRVAAEVSVAPTAAGKTAIAFVTYESRFAPCGGIAAVLAGDNLPFHLQQASFRCRTIVITPYHRHVTPQRLEAYLGLQPGDLEACLQGKVKPAQGKPQVSVLEAVQPDPGGVFLEPIHVQPPPGAQDVEWCFLRPVKPEALAVRLFAGRDNPYDLSADVLRRDALLFGRAVLPVLDRVDDTITAWKLMAQDWHGATVACYIPQALRTKYRVWLTLHNTYDAHFDGYKTVLGEALWCTEGRVFTVSRQFALDIVEDPLQTAVIAPHLQGDPVQPHPFAGGPVVRKQSLRERLLGVDNGPFIGNTIPPNELNAARQEKYPPLEGWKSAQRQKALALLGEHKPSSREPLWGDARKFDPSGSACWFAMAGRDDPGQRGHDVAVAAARELLQGGCADACFLFFVMPSEAGIAGLRFVEELAREFPKYVLALPFRWQAGYTAAVQGAAFGVMPSLYEPFGGANEFYLWGASAVARATGGLIEQIVPLWGGPSCTADVRRRALVYHRPDARPTGILFREETDGDPTPDWRALNAGNYRIGDRVNGRKGVKLFQQMTAALVQALRDAMEVYRQRDVKQVYYRMVVGGLDHVMRTFSWGRAAREYWAGINKP